MINEENIELMLFRYCEGMLSDAERDEMEQALASHAEWRALVEDYNAAPALPAAKPAPAATADALRDGGNQRRVIPLWLRGAVAASVLLAVAMTLLFGSHGKTSTPIVAQKEAEPKQETLQEEFVEQMIEPSLVQTVGSTQQPMMVAMADEAPLPETAPAVVPNDSYEWAMQCELAELWTLPEAELSDEAEQPQLFDSYELICRDVEAPASERSTLSRIVSHTRSAVAKGRELVDGDDPVEGVTVQRRQSTLRQLWALMQ